MRLWTYLLPTAVWLWFVRRNCERVRLGNGVIAHDAGRFLIVSRRDARQQGGG